MGPRGTPTIEPNRRHFEILCGNLWSELKITLNACRCRMVSRSLSGSSEFSIDFISVRTLFLLWRLINFYISYSICISPFRFYCQTGEDLEHGLPDPVAVLKPTSKHPFQRILLFRMSYFLACVKKKLYMVSETDIACKKKEKNRVHYFAGELYGFSLAWSGQQAFSAVLLA